MTTEAVPERIGDGARSVARGTADAVALLVSGCVMTVVVLAAQMVRVLGQMSGSRREGRRPRPRSLIDE